MSKPSDQKLDATVLHPVAASATPDENRRSTKFFTPPASIVHNFGSVPTADNGGRQTIERMSLFRRLTLPFRRSIRHDVQHDKDAAKANLKPTTTTHPTDENMLKKNDDSVNTQQGSSRQPHPDEEYCRETLDRVSALWFGTTANRQEAFDLLEQGRLKCVMIPEYTARLAQSLAKRAVDIHDESIRKSMLHEALELSKMALKSANNKSALCHFCYAHIIGVLLEKNQFSLKDKLAEAALFKYHMQQTIKIDPNFYEAYAYLGRYEYIAYNLSVFERKGASILGYTIEGNLDKALEYLLLAIKGDCDMMHTIYLLLGKIYNKKKQYADAKLYLNKCINLPVQRKSQTVLVNEAKILLKEKKIENSSLNFSYILSIPCKTFILIDLLSLKTLTLYTKKKEKNELL